MKKTTILVCSLLATYFGRRAEDRILEQFVKQYVASTDEFFEMTLLLGSVDSAVLERTRVLLAPFNIKADTVVLPFKFRDAFNDRRSHEISFCKRALTRHAMTLPHDVFVHLDSDIAIDFTHIIHLAKSLPTHPAFINIPYVIHHQLSAPRVQFGAYMHRRAMFDALDYSESIYRLVRRGDKLFRHNSPDCAIREYLLNKNVSEIAARPPTFRVQTRHYSDNGTFGLYDSGEMSRHFDCELTLGFDPVKDDMGMEPVSCEFLANCCRATNTRFALDIGTGQGNALRSLIVGGAQDILSVDGEEHWSRLPINRGLRSSFAATVQLLTCPTRNESGVISYDLSALASRRFDLAVIDGPKGGGRGRLNTALTVNAANYVFHDAIRDREMVMHFAQRMERAQILQKVIWSDKGRGIAHVAVQT